MHVATVMQDHCVIPIYKTEGSVQLLTWPISILCVLSKLLERIVYNHIIIHVQSKLTKH